MWNILSGEEEMISYGTERWSKITNAKTLYYSRYYKLLSCSLLSRAVDHSRTVWRTSNGCVASSAAEQTWTCGMTPIAVDCRPRSRCSPCQTDRNRNVRLLSASIRHPKRPGNLPPSPAWPSRSPPWISC